MQEKRLSRSFHWLLWGGAGGVLLLYVMVEGNICNSLLPRLPFLVGTIVISVLYLLRYRRDYVFCYEFFFILLYIVSVYFDDIVIENLSDKSNISSVLYGPSFSVSVENKALLVSTISHLVFLLAASRENAKPLLLRCNNFNLPPNGDLTSLIMSVIVGAYIGFLALNGTITSWFHYSGVVENYSNTEIMYLTVLFVVFTSVEFLRLHEKGCKSFKSFLKSVGKGYLFEVSLVSVLLLISGNRNEFLLISLPVAVAYNIFIKRYSNRLFLLLSILGAVVMVFIGLTRQSGNWFSLQGNSVTLLEVTRDYGLVDNNTKFLIDYVGRESLAGFKNAMLILFSSVPLLGGLFVGATGIEPDIRSPDLTTQGMQVAANMDSGLGTSLWGDLYYTGGMIFTIIFMYLLGTLIARLHRYFFLEKKYSIWSLVVYLFMFANVVYYVRAEWTMPLRYIGFSFVVLFFLQMFQPDKR